MDHPPPSLGSLRRVPLFEGLTDEQLGALRESLHETAFPAGVDIMMEDQPGDLAYVILTGGVKIHVERSDGTQVILSLLGPGQVVGEMSLVDSLGRSASVATLEESRLLWMDREGFWELLRTTPRMTYNLVELLSRRLRLANAHVETLAALDVPGRLARVVLALAEEYGMPDPSGHVRVSLPLTQGDLAALVGASRVRVNQVLGAFRRRGLLSIEDHRFTVHDAQGLAARCR